MRTPRLNVSVVDECIWIRPDHDLRQCFICLAGLGSDVHLIFQSIFNTQLQHTDHITTIKYSYKPPKHKKRGFLFPVSDLASIAFIFLRCFCCVGIEANQILSEFLFVLSTIYPPHIYSGDQCHEEQSAVRDCRIQWLKTQQ